MRIGIIGHFGGGKVFTDGQTVKTVTLYQALLEKGFEKVTVHKIDTYYIKKNPVKFLAQMYSCVFKDKKIIVLLSSNGRKVLFPILYVMQKYLGKEIYHYGIGGRLVREVQEKPTWKKYVASFSGNWMESKELVEGLHKLGIKNARYIPNFKRITPLRSADFVTENEKPFGFCTFSRVMKEKGITDAIDAIVAVNEQAGETVATLDIYGPITDNYKEELDSKLKESEGVCRYCGVVEPSKSVDVLKLYHCLLFPTHWKHEGIPGTIIDALAAGVPVIARRWQYCDEMITNGVTGYSYDFDRPHLLVDQIKLAIENPAGILKMRSACLEKAQKYSEPVVLQQICIQMKLDLEEN